MKDKISILALMMAIGSTPSAPRREFVKDPLSKKRAKARKRNKVQKESRKKNRK